MPGIAYPELPYDFAELEPAMSRDALWFHFSQHRRGCFDRAMALVQGTEFEHLALEDLLRATARAPKHRAVFCHAAGSWNHNFFWKSMRPGGGGEARGLIAECIRARFGSYADFAREVKDKAVRLFGNGWLWVTWKAGAIRIVATANADTPIVRGHVALLALDLWEHAYYLDHQNRRTAYVTTFLEELVDWDFANRNLAGVIEAPPAPRSRRGRDARVARGTASGSRAP